MIQCQMFVSMLQKHFNVSIQFLIQGKHLLPMNIGLITGLALFLFLSSILASQVRPCLEKLNQDTDHDVQYFAREALESKSFFIYFDSCFNEK